LIIAAMTSVLVLESCYSYQAVSVDRKFIIKRSGADDAVTAGKTKAGAATFRLPVKKIFVRMNSLSPVAAINNRAVDLSAQGRFGEAEILFREVLLEGGPDPAVYNNLGIICETAGYRDEAFRMYDTACRLMPENRFFRQNFLSFADYRQGTY
jgi:Flp pilus assembly protein TadD